MLKKAGIVAATTAAGLLMASPLAFAGTSEHEHVGPHKGHMKAEEEEYNGINVLNENNVVVPVQACGDQVAVVGLIVPVLSPNTTACTATTGIIGD